MEDFTTKKLAANIPAELLYDFQRAAHRQEVPQKEAFLQMTEWFVQKYIDNSKSFQYSINEINHLTKEATEELNMDIPLEQYNTLAEIIGEQELSMSEITTQMMVWYLHIFDEVVTMPVEDDEPMQVLLNAMIPNRQEQTNNVLYPFGLLD